MLKHTKLSSLKFYFLPLWIFPYVNHRSLHVISYQDIYNSKIINTVKPRLRVFGRLTKTSVHLLVKEPSIIRPPRYYVQIFLAHW